MRMSDAITTYILNRIEAEEAGFVELQRNALALEIGCVPSQINYVLSSRFTPERGYIVESRRGGGGYIRIERIRFADERAVLSHIINALGPTLTHTAAVAIIQHLCDENTLHPQTALAMASAVSDKALVGVPPSARNAVRSDLLKHMLAAVLTR